MSESFVRKLCDFTLYDNEHSIMLALFLMWNSDIHMKLVTKTRVEHVLFPDSEGGVKSVSPNHTFSMNY